MKLSLSNVPKIKDTLAFLASSLFPFHPHPVRRGIWTIHHYTTTTITPCPETAADDYAFPAIGPPCRGSGHCYCAAKGCLPLQQQIDGGVVMLCCYFLKY